MTSVTISSDDPRSIKAVELAAGASGWLKCRLADGRKAHGIASERKRGVYHLANCHECTCWDFRHRQQPCKHVQAVRLHVELVRASRTRAQRLSADRPYHRPPQANAAMYERIFGGED